MTRPAAEEITIRFLSVVSATETGATLKGMKDGLYQAFQLPGYLFDDFPCTKQDIREHLPFMARVTVSGSNVTEMTIVPNWMSIVHEYKFP